MPTDWLIRNLLVSLFLPPANVLALALLALICWRRWPRLAAVLVLVAGVGLWAQSTPWMAHRLLRSLDVAAPLLPDQLPPTDANGDGRPDANVPQAIVILGGGSTLGSPEYGREQGADLGEYTLARVRYGAFLARRTGLPVLVSGGSPSGRSIAEARLMAKVLNDEFGVPARWVEAQSLNTEQNAGFSARMLTNGGITRIYLVTNAWHMRRSLAHFRAVGLAVTPAPCCNAQSLTPDAVPGWWPTIDAMRDTRVSLREWMAAAAGH